MRGSAARSAGGGMRSARVMRVIAAAGGPARLSWPAASKARARRAPKKPQPPVMRMCMGVCSRANRFDEGPTMLFSRLSFGARQGDARENLDDGAVVFAAETGGGGLHEHLVCRAGQRQRKFAGAGGVQHQAQVLDEDIHRRERGVVGRQDV